MAKRVDNLELERRIAHVVEMLVDGFKTGDICNYAAQKDPAPDGSGGWGVSRSQANRYIDAARKALEESVKPKRSYLVELSSRRLDMLFHESLAAGDHRTALLVQREINELFRLHGEAPKEEEEKRIIFYMPSNGR